MRRSGEAGRVLFSWFRSRRGRGRGSRRGGGRGGRRNRRGRELSQDPPHLFRRLAVRLDLEEALVGAGGLLGLAEAKQRVRAIEERPLLGRVELERAIER